MKIIYTLLVFLMACFIGMADASAQELPLIKKKDKASRKVPNQLSGDRLDRAEKKAFRVRFDGDRVTGRKYQGSGSPVTKKDNDDFTEKKGYYSERNVKKIAKAKEKAAPAQQQDRESVAVE